MSEQKKELVSFGRFVELLNEELMNSGWYQNEMKFINVGTGYDFIAPTLSIMENKELDKRVFDRASIKYTITRP
jgi:hypothetical protein